MAENFICNKWKQLLVFPLFLFSISNTSVYGFERSPIAWATTGIYFSTPYQAACEYWASRRDIEYVGIPDSQHAAIVSMWVIPWGWNQGVLTMNTLPAVQYQCGVKIHHYGNPPSSPPYDYDWRFGGAYPVCNFGDSPYVPSDTLCLASDILPDKGANLGHPQLGSCVGNPVNTATGNKYAEEMDLISSGGLKFSRYYNSTRLSGGSSWSHSFQRNLYVNPQTITATRPDGRAAYFRLTNSAWVNQQAGGDILTQISGGTGWQLTTSEDVIETYNTSGKLLSITDRNDRTQTLSYDANGRLTTVTDDTGRTLSFTYDGSSRINTMTDPANGVTQYTYDTTGNLTSVIYPDGKTRTYHYNEQAYTGNANLPNALTGITDENGVRFATYTYDTQGRAVVTEHAGGALRYSFSYNADRTTTITDPLGSAYIHKFHFILGLAKSTGQSQPAGSGCSAASSNTTYDVNGNVASRADFNGNKTCYAYDLTRNLEIARVEGLGSGNNCPADLLSYTPAANSSERKILTTWHTNFRLPTLIAEFKRETKYVYDTRGNITQYQIKDTATNAARTWNTSYSYHASIPGVILQKTENGPRSDVTDVITTQLRTRCRLYWRSSGLPCTSGQYHQCFRPCHADHALQCAWPTGRNHRSERADDNAGLRCPSTAALPNRWHGNHQLSI